METWAFGPYTIIELVPNKTESTHFIKGKVVSSKTFSAGTEIICVRSGLRMLGLDYPSNYAIIRSDEVVASIDK